MGTSGIHHREIVMRDADGWTTVTLTIEDEAEIDVPRAFEIKEIVRSTGPGRETWTLVDEDNVARLMLLAEEFEEVGRALTNTDREDEA